MCLEGEQAPPYARSKTSPPSTGTIIISVLVIIVGVGVPKLKKMKEIKR